MHKQKQTNQVRFRFVLPLVAGLVSTVLTVFSLVSVNFVRAATGTNEQLNYQARLLTSTGAVVPDGLYNIEFKVYEDGDGVLGGGDETLQWTETRTGGNRVTVKNGYFSVYLGSVNPFGSSIDWNQDTLWLSINIGGTGTPSFDGEMSPFTRFSSTPYALNSKQLGGLTSGQFVQLAQGQQTENSSSASIYINDTGGGNLIHLLSGGNNRFVVNNSGAIAAATALDTINGVIINAGAISGVTGFTQASGAFAFSGGGNFSIDSAGFDVTTGGAIAASSALFSSTVQYVNGTTNTDTLVCRNGSGQLAACSNAALTGTAFIQNGNSFGGQAVLGTNDGNSLAFETGSTTKLVLDTSGNLQFQQASTVSSSAGALTLQPNTGSNLNVSLATTGDFAVNTNQLYVDTSAAAVGIGTGTPGEELHVAGGDIYISDTGNGVASPSEGRMIFDNQFDSTGNTTANKVVLYDNGSNLKIGLGVSAFDFDLFTGVNSNFRFYTGHSNEASEGTEVLTITGTNNNIGINDASPDAELEVVGTTEQLRLSYTDGSVDSRFSVDSSGNLTIDNTGTKTVVADDLQVNGNDLLDSGSNIRVSLGATTGISGILDVSGSFLAGTSDAFGVSSGGNITSAASSGNGITFSNTGLADDIVLQNGISVQNDTSGTLRIEDSSNNLLASIVDNGTTATLNAHTINATSTFQLNGTNGRTVSCGNNEYLESFVLTGGIHTSGTCQADGLSDQNLKDNIVSLSSSILDDIREVNVVNFDFDCSNAIFSQNGGRYDCEQSTQAGVIAQELQQIFPELVTMGGDGYYRVNYDGLSMYNLKAVQELAGLIDATGNAELNTVTIDGNLIVTSSGQLQNVTGLTVVSGGANLTGGVDNNSGGITEAGAISGATTINASGAITAATSTNTINGLVVSSGALSGVTTLSLSGAISGGTTYSGSGNINTTAGAIRTNSTDRIENDGDLVNIGNINATSATFSGAVAANGGITFNNATDTLGAHTLAGTLDANANILTNIGNAGTDFIASTGALTLAGVLTANNGVTVTGNSTIAGTLGSLTGLSSSGTVTFGGLNSVGIVRTNASGVLATGALNRNDSAYFNTTLSVGNGGTGATTFTTNGILFGNAATNIQATAAGTGGQVLLANGSGVPTFTTFTGDITVSSAGLTAIQANSVALGTDTTGNYVATVTVGNGLAVSGVGAETATADISLDVATTGTTSTTNSNSGLETTATGLKLLGGCSNGQILKWQGGSTAWQCSTDNQGLSDSTIKTGVVALPSVLDSIKNLEVVDYNYKCNDPTWSSYRFVCDDQTGVLAQQLALVFPDLVSLRPDSLFQVDFQRLNFYTLKAVTELANFIDSGGNGAFNTVSTGGTQRISSSGALSNISTISASGNINTSGGAFQTAGTTRLTNAGALQNITGLTVTSGGASITGATTLSGGTINLNAGGLLTNTNINTGASTGTVTIGGGLSPLVINSTAFDVSSTGAVSGVTTLATSGTISTTGGNIFLNNALGDYQILRGVTTYTGIDVNCGNNQYMNQINVRGGIVTSYSACSGVGLSDERLKENITSLDDSIADLIKQVNTVTFTFKCDDPAFEIMNEQCQEGVQTGVIAQQLAQVFPELVYEDEWGNYRVKYDALNIYTLKAVGEISEDLDEVEANSVNEVAVLGLIDTQMQSYLNNGLTISGSSSFDGNVAFNDAVDFMEDVIFNKDVIFNARPVFNNDTAGFATIEEDDTEVRIEFANEFADMPVVNINNTDGQFIAYTYKDLDETGFTIIIQNPAQEDITFSWTAFAVDDALTQLSSNDVLDN